MDDVKKSLKILTMVVALILIVMMFYIMVIIKTVNTLSDSILVIQDQQDKVIDLMTSDAYCETNDHG